MKTMLNIRENEPLRPKTTMRIGGNARYYAELATRNDVEAAVQFANEKKIPLIVLGGGSNTIFADGLIEALVVRITAQNVSIQSHDLTSSQAHVTVQSGKNLAQFVNEMSNEGLDLSPLTGILGTAGGAVFGNSGQGPQGMWVNRFVECITFFYDDEWKTLNKDDCDFRYRESWFKDRWAAGGRGMIPPVIWETTFVIPRRDPREIREEIEKLLKRRIETQPHVKTAGSCFKAAGSTPAWRLIDAAGLRGAREGGVVISEKHANFLINDNNGTFEDAVKIIKDVKSAVSESLSVEMRLIRSDGTLEF